MLLCCGVFVFVHHPSCIFTCQTELRVLSKNALKFPQQQDHKERQPHYYVQGEQW